MLSGRQKAMHEIREMSKIRCFASYLIMYMSPSRALGMVDASKKEPRTSLTFLARAAYSPFLSQAPFADPGMTEG